MVLSYSTASLTSQGCSFLILALILIWYCLLCIIKYEIMYMHIETLWRKYFVNILYLINSFKPVSPVFTLFYKLTLIDGTGI